LRFPTKKIGAFVAIIAATVYLGLSGANIATQRAYIMALVILVAVLIDRPAFTLRAVGLAALIVLLIRPETMLQPGFQMSFAATTGLVAVFDRMRSFTLLQDWPFLIRIPVNFVFFLALSSFVAGTATAPFSAFHFNQMAQYGLLANILAVPLMGMMVMPSAVLALLCFPLGAEGVAFEAMGLGISWILMVAHFVAGLDGSVLLIVKPYWWVLPILTLGLLWACLWPPRIGWLGALPCLYAASHWAATDRPDVLITENGRLIGVQTEEGRAINLERGQSFAVDSWLENDAQGVDRESALRFYPFRGPEGRMQLWEDPLIHYSYAKEKVTCEGALLIVPRLRREDVEGKNCSVFAAEDFRQKGAISIDVNNGITITGARSVTVGRPWSPPVPQ
jgi:competence protein ComEC